MKPLNPLRNPVTGEVINYVPAMRTDIRQTFAKYVVKNGS